MACVSIIKFTRIIANISGENVYNEKMKILKYQWILVFFIVWFPLQGVTAAVLSVCVQEDFSSHHDRTMMTADNHHHEDCHKQATNVPTDHLIASLPCDDISCDAYGNPPILSGCAVSMLINDTSAVTSYDSGFVSFVPEQPQRPPLAASL